MHVVGKSDLTTGNKEFASIVVQSNELVFAFTAPYNTPVPEDSQAPYPFCTATANKFIIDHGLAVRSVGIRVADAKVAYETCVANGAEGIAAPRVCVCRYTGKTMVISETKYYGDVVARWVSGEYDGVLMPNYEPVESADMNIGIKRLDHAVTNVPNLFEAVDYITHATGFHEFSEFTADDVGTVDSGLNSMVLANNNEFILLPVNEPTHGTRRKSQIQTYLDYNNGPGIQHLALKTDDIFRTMKEMKQRGHVGGFEFMPAPNHVYYDRIPERIGDNVLTPEQLKDVQDLGLLVDKDDQGVLVQVFTKPLGDRPTIFIEIIQRIGCDKDECGVPKEQAAGCGGFGKGNFAELFKSIEEYEKLQEVTFSANAVLNA